MQREIKQYRAWDKEGKEMWPVTMIDWDKEAVRFEGNPSDYNSDATFDQIELMQSTGLLDKNNVEIYDGDIVKTIEIIDGNFVNKIIKEYLVIYRGVSFQFKPLASNTPFTINPLSVEQNEIELIGNKFENPELLQK